MFDNTEKICYVCFENCEELSKCRCKDIYLHLECQKNIISSNNNYNCTICRQKYFNVVHSNINGVYNHNCFHLFSLCFTLIFLFFTSLSEILIGIYIIKDFDINPIILFYIILTVTSSIGLFYIKIKLFLYIKENFNNHVRIIDYDSTVTIL